MKTQWIICTAMAALFVSNPRLHSQVVPDASFGSGGVVITDYAGNINEAAADIIVQGDGKILVGGFTNDGVTGCDFLLIRYNTDGSLDNSFGTGGFAVTNLGVMDYGGNISLQTDGKILLTGKSIDSLQECQIVVLRYNTDGSLDNSFSSDGIAWADLDGVCYDYYYSDGSREVIQQTDGKIVVIANRYTDPDFEFAIIRFNSDGSLDPSFDGDGIVNSNFTSTSVMVSGNIQTDGKILVGGSIGGDFGLARYNSNGSLDNSFDGDGFVTTSMGPSNDFGGKVLIQADGKILLIGSGSVGAGTDFSVARYNINGSLDNSFDGDGKVLAGMANGGFTFDGAIMPNGNILISGTSGYEVAMACIKPDGSLDSTFDSDGKYTQLFNGGNISTPNIALQTDGKMLSAGYDGNFPVDVVVIRFGSTPTYAGIDPGSDILANSMIFPNPTVGAIGLKTPEDLENASFRITNESGQIMYSGENLNGRSFDFDISTLSKGTYFMTVTNETTRHTWKVIKQ